LTPIPGPQANDDGGIVRGAVDPNAARPAAGGANGPRS
jgi:hypothetical protein